MENKQQKPVYAPRKVVDVRKPEPKEDGYFQNRDLRPDQRKTHPDIDLEALYERCVEELGLQQTKRDQIITVFLGLVTFLVPLALNINQVSWAAKGWIFLAVTMVGALFSLVIARYRVYKEIYWLCCQSITVLHSMHMDRMDKPAVQAVFYGVLKKKGTSYCIKEEVKYEGSDQYEERLRFSRWLYLKKNIFSAETMYFLIHSLITALLLGLSIALILPLSTALSVICAIVVGVLLLVGLLAFYFHECIKVYGVLIDEKDSSFNFAFKSAWFLHFFVS